MAYYYKMQSAMSPHAILQASATRGEQWQPMSLVQDTALLDTPLQISPSMGRLRLQPAVPRMLPYEAPRPICLHDY